MGTWCNCIECVGESQEPPDDELMFCECGAEWDEEELAANRCKSCGLQIESPNLK